MYQIIPYNKKCQLLSLRQSNMWLLLAICQKREWQKASNRCGVEPASLLGEMENSLQMRQFLSSMPVLGIALQPLYFTFSSPINCVTGCATIPALIFMPVNKLALTFAFLSRSLVLQLILFELLRNWIGVRSSSSSGYNSNCAISSGGSCTYSACLY